MISVYDYLNIGFYFAFIVGVGVWFARKSRDTSDYFRAGGSLPWWVSGSSAWMASFSAWTFTGAAAKIYETGPYVLCLYYANLVPCVVLLTLTCYRFRRLRVVTPLEGLRLRFGGATQQSYNAARLLVMLVFSAFSLYAVAVFMAAIFDVSVVPVIVLLGGVITLLSVLGGALGVAAIDFVQMLIVVAMTLVITLRVLARPEIAGLAGLITKVPPVHFEWGRIARPEFIALWFIALTVNTTLGRNSLADDSAAKYMSTRSDRDARLMVWIPLVGALIGPVIWFIPPMAAAVLHPHLAAEYPALRYPDEAAFLAMARDVLPQGMLGLLVCTIFASTLSTLDARVNQAAGILVRNVYLPLIDRACPERRLLFLSKTMAAGMGILILVLAVIVDRYRDHGLFDLLNQVGIALGLPLAIPACLGLFYHRTPGWSGWSSVLVGFAMSLSATFWVKPEMLGLALAGEERTIFTLVATVTVTVVGSSLWFFGSSLFYSRAPIGFRRDVEEFFLRLRTPLPRQREPELPGTRQFPVVVGWLALAYGALICALAIIPNPPAGRLCYLGIGGGMVITGVLLLWVYGSPRVPSPDVVHPKPFT